MFNEIFIKIIVVCFGIVVPISLFLFYRIIGQYDKEIERLKNRPCQQYGEHIAVIEKDLEWIKKRLNGLN